jgi:hypothetical protein
LLDVDIRDDDRDARRDRAMSGHDDPRVLTPETFGWGLGLNCYWLLHPVRLVRARRRSR